MNHKILITKGALRGLIAAYLLVVVGFLGIWHLQHKQAGTAAANRRAIIYICSTTKVLDRLVVTAADQVHGSLQNGTYKRLLKTGVVTQKNIDDARATLHQYRKAHVKLTSASACNDVLARP